VPAVVLPGTRPSVLSLGQRNSLIGVCKAAALVELVSGCV
jgi:hypothetical protein